MKHARNAFVVLLISLLTVTSLRPAAHADNNAGLTREATIQLLNDLGVTVNGHYSPASGGVASITGTANQINRDAATGAVTLSFPAAVAMSSALANGNDVLTITKNPAEGQVGAVLHVVGGDNQQGDAILVDHPNGLGYAIRATGYSGNPAFSVDYAGAVRMITFQSTRALLVDGLGYGINIDTGTGAYATMSATYGLSWSDVDAYNGTKDLVLSRLSANVLAVGATASGGHDGKIAMGGTTASGTLAPTWTNSPTALIGAQNPYTWLKFVAPDGTNVYVPAFK